MYTINSILSTARLHLINTGEVKDLPVRWRCTCSRQKASLTLMPRGKKREKIISWQPHYTLPYNERLILISKNSNVLRPCYYLCYKIAYSVFFLLSRKSHIAFQALLRGWLRTTKKHDTQDPVVYSIHLFSIVTWETATKNISNSIQYDTVRTFQ